MRFYHALIIILLLPVLLFGAEWENLNLDILGSGQSDEKGSTRYRMCDASGRPFEVNYASIPDENTRKRVVELKDIFYGWKQIKIGLMEFYFSTDGIYSNIKTVKIEYMGENLLPYLPAGLAFQDTKDGLYYRFRIVVDSNSFMLEGPYKDEEALLREIYNFIKTKKKEGEVKQAATEEKKEKTPQKISLCLYGNYVQPTGDLTRLFSSGYGAMAGITLHDTGISLNDETLFHLDFTLATGYRFMKDDPEPQISCSIDRAYIIPFNLYAKYNIDITKEFFVSPFIGVGYNYNRIDYVELTPTGLCTSVTTLKWAPSLSAGILLNYNINDNVTLVCGAEYTAMFERHMTDQYLVFNLGVDYSFTIQGN